MKVSIKLTANNFTTDTKEEMWNVYKPYYNSNGQDFIKRIVTNKQFAIYEHNGKIVGFTGIRINRTKVDGKRKMLIYFGQTVIEQSFRGNALLTMTALKVCLKYFKELILSDVYFWYDALSYKSYLVSAKSLKEFYPSHMQQTPHSIKRLINFIGQKHYQGSFCEELGTVVKSNIFVNDPSVSIGINDIKDKDIQFFMKANPNYDKGHGLITLTPMNRKNVLVLVKRFWVKFSKNIAIQVRSLSQSFRFQLIKLLFQREDTVNI